jgi:hypothetical protein
MGFDRAWFAGCVTSGEVAWTKLLERTECVYDYLLGELASISTVYAAQTLRLCADAFTSTGERREAKLCSIQLLWESRM